MYAAGEPANASLHHVGCRPPDRHDGPMEAVSDTPHLTWRAGTFGMPALLKLGVASDGTPFFLVNPSYEAALLQYSDGENGNDGENGDDTEDGPGWQVGTVGVYEELGLDDLQIGLHVATGEIAVGVAALAGTGGGKGGRRREHRPAETAPWSDVTHIASRHSGRGNHLSTGRSAKIGHGAD
ncbi:hypothetical protein ACQF36_06025 [Streptomyces sp. Marseille-Q5077]|uniref:hypothetical protein n=1 Tax=Streptomyces sp. Marseille-Q5077 TaxID=3418995 RepID=UPI003D092DEF